jgi:SIR2-like domain
MSSSTTNGERFRGALSKANPTFRDLVEGLAATNDPVIVAGAGCSMDAGLPSWSGLVRRLLEPTIRNVGDEERSGLVDEIIDSFGLIGASTVARIETGNRDQWEAAVRDALYGREKCGHIQPGALAVLIAQLAYEFPNASVFTTNFDDLIDRALIEHRPKDALRIKALHLHGYVPQTGKCRGPLVMDEYGYAVAANSAAKQLAEALANRTALFIGMSMTDTDIVQAI